MKTATAVSRIDNLEFLADVIPRTTTYKQFKEKKAKEGPVQSGGVEKGQRTLNGTKPLKSKANGKTPEKDHSAAAAAEKEKPVRSAGAPITLVVDRTVETPPTGTPGDHDRDIDMKDQ